MKTSKCAIGLPRLNCRFLCFDESDVYKNYFITVFELCSKTLEDYMRNEVDDADTNQILLPILQSHIVPALRFLHDQEICHGDIKVAIFLT